MPGSGKHREEALCKLAEALFPAMPDEADTAERAGDKLLARYYRTQGFFDPPAQAALAFELLHKHVFGENRAQLLVWVQPAACCALLPPLLRPPLTRAARIRAASSGCSPRAWARCCWAAGHAFVPRWPFLLLATCLWGATSQACLPCLDLRRRLWCVGDTRGLHGINVAY